MKRPLFRPIVSALLSVSLLIQSIAPAFADSHYSEEFNALRDRARIYQMTIGREIDVIDGAAHALGKVHEDLLRLRRLMTPAALPLLNKDGSDDNSISRQLIRAELEDLRMRELEIELPELSRRIMEHLGAAQNGLNASGEPHRSPTRKAINAAVSKSQATFDSLWKSLAERRERARENIRAIREEQRKIGLRAEIESRQELISEMRLMDRLAEADRVFRRIRSGFDSEFLSGRFELSAEQIEGYSWFLSTMPAQFEPLVNSDRKRARYEAFLENHRGQLEALVRRQSDEDARAAIEKRLSADSYDSGAARIVRVASTLSMLFNETSTSEQLKTKHPVPDDVETPHPDDHPGQIRVDGKDYKVSGGDEPSDKGFSEARSNDEPDSSRGIEFGTHIEILHSVPLSSGERYRGEVRKAVQERKADPTPPTRAKSERKTEKTPAPEVIHQPPAGSPMAGLEEKTREARDMVDRSHDRVRDSDNREELSNLRAEYDAVRAMMQEYASEMESRLQNLRELSRSVAEELSALQKIASSLPLEKFTPTPERLEELSRTTVELGKTAVSTAFSVGFGVVYDATELVHAFQFGTDLWGRPVDGLDISLMGIAVVVGALEPAVAKGPILREIVRTNRASVAIGETAPLARTFELHSPVDPGHLHFLPVNRDVEARAAVARAAELLEKGEISAQEFKKILENHGGSIAATFRSGTYSATKSQGSLKLFRVISVEREEIEQFIREATRYYSPEQAIEEILDRKKLGGYWSVTQPKGPTESVISQALRPSFKNRATHYVEMKLPEGLDVFIGMAASQQDPRWGSFLIGGGSQAFLDEKTLHAIRKLEDERAALRAKLPPGSIIPPELESILSPVKPLRKKPSPQPLRPDVLYERLGA